MKKLILSLDTYSWVKYCCGLILENSSEFQILILYRDNGLDGILAYPRLCLEAITAQRRHDTTRAGKKLGVKKLSNLNYDKHIDVEQLSMNLHLQVTLAGINEIYYQENDVLTPIIQTIGETLNIETYSFGELDKIPKKTIDITKYYEHICEIKDIMIGVSSKEQLDFPIIEEFY